MGTGIVSIAFDLDDLDAISDVTLWIAVGIAVALTAWLVVLGARGDLRAKLPLPDGLTLVAAPCVLGARLALARADAAAAVALAIGLTAGAWLLPAALRHEKRSGSAFLTAVAVLSVSTLFSYLATHLTSEALAFIALAPLAGGLGLYAEAASRFDPRHLRHGRGDHWIAGGALALASVACALGVQALRHTDTARLLSDALGTLDWILWFLAIAWLVALVVAEVRWPRPWLDPRRWSTVFPVGMYAVASFAVGRVEAAGALRSVASVWVWVALAVWTGAAFASLRLLAGAGPRARTG